MTNKLTVSLAAALLLLACAACSDDPATNPDGAVSPDQGINKKEAGPADGPKGEGKQQKDQALPDSKPPAPDQKIPAHWTTVTTNPPVTSYHTATLLPNGDVLIVGGTITDSSNNDVIQKKAYRYQTSKGAFVAAGEMATERESHTATLLNSGKVLVTGGSSDKTYLEKTEIFDPASMKWTAGPDMSQSRWDHAAVRLKNNWVLVTGGFGSSGSISAVTLYDPSSNTFKTPAAAMKVKRRGHTMTLLSDGRVLIAGGIYDGKNTWTWKSSDTTEIYDPKNGSFTAGPQMARGRNAHTATVRANGSVLIVGGVAWGATSPKILNDLYDPVKGTMTTVAYPASYLPAGHSAMLLSDGRVLVVDDERTVAFSPKMGGVWDTLPTLPDKRWGFSATLLKTNKVLVVGGVLSSSPYTLAKTALMLHL